MSQLTDDSLVRLWKLVLLSSYTMQMKLLQIYVKLLVHIYFEHDNNTAEPPTIEIHVYFQRILSTDTEYGIIAK